MKSMMGYAVAAVAAYVIWIVVSKILDEAKPVKENIKVLANRSMVYNRISLVDLVIT